MFVRIQCKISCDFTSYRPQLQEIDCAYLFNIKFKNFALSSKM